MQKGRDAPGVAPLLRGVPLLAWASVGLSPARAADLRRRGGRPCDLPLDLELLGSTLTAITRSPVRQDGGWERAVCTSWAGGLQAVQLLRVVEVDRLDDVVRDAARQGEVRIVR